METTSILSSSPAMFCRLMRCFQQKLMVVHISLNFWSGRRKQTPGYSNACCVGCSCETVHESCHTFQRYRQIRAVTATRCPIPPDTGVEGQLTAVSARWHEQEGHYRTVDMLEAHCEHVSAWYPYLVLWQCSWYSVPLPFHWMKGPSSPAEWLLVSSEAGRWTQAASAFMLSCVFP